MSKSSFSVDFVQRKALSYTHLTVYSNWQRIIAPLGHYFALVKIHKLHCINSAAKAVYPAVDFSCGFQPLPLRDQKVLAGVTVMTEWLFSQHITATPNPNYRYIATMVAIQ